MVYIHSTEQLTQWYKEFGLGESRVSQLPIKDIAPEVEVEGPVDNLLPRMYQLHKAYVAAEKS